MTKTMEDMEREGLDPREVWPNADIAVTYMDGFTEIIRNIRYLAVIGYSDPIVVDGTTMQVETDDGTVFNMLGVRRYTLGLPSDD